MHKRVEHFVSELEKAAETSATHFMQMWSIPGPDHTEIKRLSCYAIGKTLLIVEEFGDGGFCTFLMDKTNRIDECIRKVLNEAL